VLTVKAMTRESKIYAKEQQVKLIDNILCSLCTIELTNDGRKYLTKVKDKLKREIERLKSLEQNKKTTNSYNSLIGLKLKFPDSLRSS
jgi:hypothetical protein